jgi:hypothetical protein
MHDATNLGPNTLDGLKRLCHGPRQERYGGTGGFGGDSFRSLQWLQPAE